MDYDVRNEIAELLAVDPAAIIKLAGDASSRGYYRVLVPLASTTRIVMKMDPFVGSCDFLNIQNFLEQNKIPVPQVFEVVPAKGIIVLEDLGDETIEMMILKDPSLTQEVYGRLVQLIQQLAQLPTVNLPLVSQRLFDFEKLFWEINFTKSHLEKMVQTSLVGIWNKQKEQILAQLVSEFADLIKSIEQQPKVFSHRDFHCRNVMSLQNTFYVIDFQDARMGLIEYDLCSLLLDPYQNLNEKEIQGHLNEFILTSPKGKLAAHQNDVAVNFAMIGVQRLFKCIGSYLSFYNNKKNTHYLKYVAQALQKMACVRGQHQGVDSIVHLVTQLQIPQLVQPLLEV